jgi:glucose/arabinose dehydrogenase
MVATTLAVPEALRRGAFAQARPLQIREGFSIPVFALLQGARSMALAPWGELLVTQPSSGQIYAFGDADGDGAAEVQHVVARGLQCPYGMAFRDGALYVAQTTRIDRFPVGQDGTLGAAQQVVTGLPQSGCGPHQYRPLAIDGEGFLYTAVGSSCNVCVESDPRRGTVWRYAPDGTGQEYARGLRNVVDLAFNPQTKELWGATNERDDLGDNVPMDPVSSIQQGANYGWPFCFWNGSGWAVDTRVAAGNPGCGGLTPYNGIQAHSAPLGITFAGYASEGAVPPDYAGSAFVGLHGSWNRSEGTGFKVIRIPFANGQPQPAEDFVAGWLTGRRGPNDAWGRPVDVVMAPDGALFVSDDGAGAIYRVTYSGG